MNNIVKLLKSKVFYAFLGLAICAATVGNFVAKMNKYAESLPQQKIGVAEKFEMPVPKQVRLPEPTPVQQNVYEEKDVETATEPKPVSVMFPIDNGTVLREYSGTELVYNETMEDWRTHDGIDIAADVGTAVKAASDGVVTFCGNDGLNGFCVIINHGDYETKYCGMQESDILVTDTKVKTGDVIGGVGSTYQTEATDAPHIHFELTVNGKKVNPVDFLRDTVL